ncbi:MAG: TetR/AcrR family transcriptional regulator [Solirubrobacterales bacterium]
MPSDPPAENPHEPDELALLPHGRHGLPQEFVDRNQRQRLIASFTHLVAEVGYSGATITAVTEGAAVSSRTFYKFFETIEDVCVAAFEYGVGEVRPIVIEAWGSQRGWPERVHAVLAALLDEFSELPDLARLLTAEPFAAGPEIARRHRAAVEEMVPYLREGRILLRDPDTLPDTAERGFLGAVNSMIARHVLAGEADDLPGLLPDLSQFLLAPYMGASEARRLTAL